MLDLSELKLLDILRKRYNCEIEIHTLSTIDGEEDPLWADKFKTVFRNRMAKFVISNNSILFPIYRVQDTLIAIEIVDSMNLPPNDILYIKDCVELVFNDLYLLKEQRSIVKQRQTYLEAQLGQKSNVIPFRPRELH